MGREAGRPIPRRVFEGLFLHGLRADANLLDALRTAGFSPDDGHEAYPLEVWRDCLAVGRARVFGSLTDEQAYRALGHKFIEGFVSTPVGYVLGSAQHLFGPERTLLALSRYLHVGTEEMTLDMQMIATRTFRGLVTSRVTLPHFVAGVIEAVLRRAEITAEVLVVNEQATSYELDIRW